MGYSRISLLIVILLLFNILILFPTSHSNTSDEFTNPRTVDFDNSYQTATSLLNNTKYPGSVDPEDDDFDYYKINLKADSTSGDHITINLSLDSILDIAYIYVYNPEKYLIIEEMVWPLFDGDFNRSICACTQGDYYIVVGAYLFKAYYNLTIHYYPKVRTTDNDNSNANAKTATHGGIYSGSLNATFDYLDIYNIYLTSGTVTTEALTAELSYYDNKYLAVYNPDGTLRDISDITIGGSTTKEIVKFAAYQTGNHRVVVGVSGEPELDTSYSLKTNITEDVPADNDYDKDHALLVFNGTLINSSFNSTFDEYDYYKIDLNQDDFLMVSLKYIDGSGTTDIDIYDENDDWVNYNDDDDPEIGCWATAEATFTGRYYIEVETWWTYHGNYSILFSTSGENLWFEDVPIKMNSTNLDFSMLEDTIDMSHVNLYDIFYDPDSSIEFSSPSHPGGIGENINMQIMPNGTVKFIPHKDFIGSEIVSFTATDIQNNKLTWSVNVTVLPTNDPPKIIRVGDQIVIDNNVSLEAIQGKKWIFNITLIDSDNSEYLENQTNNSHGEPADLDFRWQPESTQGFSVIEKPDRSYIKFIPDNSVVGKYSIDLTVYDNIWHKPDEVSKLVKIETSNHTIKLIFEIENVNDPPKFLKIGGESVAHGEITWLKAFEDSWNNYSVDSYDVDNDVGQIEIISYSTNVTDPAFHINAVTGEISFFPTQKYVGNFFAKIIVWDDKGGKTTQNITINVWEKNDIPTGAKIIILQEVFLNIQFKADDAFDEDGDILTYTWDFGDNTTEETGIAVEHTYKKAGVYLVVLNVSDGKGGIDSASNMISVEAPPKDKPQDDDSGSTKKGDFLSDNWLMILTIIIIIIIVAIVVSVMIITKKKEEGKYYSMSPPGPPDQQSRVSQPLQQAQVYEVPPPSPEEKIELLEEQLLRGEIDQNHFRDTRSVYEAEMVAQQQIETDDQSQTVEQTYITPGHQPAPSTATLEQSQVEELPVSEQLPAPGPMQIQPSVQPEQPIQPPQTEPSQVLTSPQPVQAQQAQVPPQPPQEQNLTNCPVCNAQIQFYAPVCNSCGTEMDWEI